ncbi:MAG: universal stress protein [Salinisphaera sp.]|jgi:nucleotide-binding universal stress UspA family protein|nr:universal stress protein [Salinisphaera sp.]
MLFNHVLVPLDGSHMAERALSQAQRLVKTAGGELHLLQVVPTRSEEGSCQVDPLDWRMQHAKALSYLNGLVERLSGEGTRVTAHVEDGDPVQQILEFAKRDGTDLIVLSACGRGGLSRFHLGGTVQKAMRRTHTSVFISHAMQETGLPGRSAYRRVLLPLDGSCRAEWAVHQIAALMRDTDAELILLHVVVMLDELSPALMTGDIASLRKNMLAEELRVGQDYLKEVRGHLQHGLNITTRVVRAPSAAREIVRMANSEAVDMIALTAHGAAGESSWALGSVADAVVGHSMQSVLLFQDLPDEHPTAGQITETARCRSGLFCDV